MAQSKPEFPSSEFLQKVDTLRTHKKGLKEEIEKVERKHHLARKNREVLELEGKDPSQVIKELELELKSLQRQAEGMRSESYNMFSAEFNRYKTLQAEIWKGYYEQTIRPRKDRLAAAEQQLETIFSELADALVGTPAQDAEMLEAINGLDAGITSFEELRKEFGAAGNFRLSQNDQSSKIIATDTEDDVRNVNNKIKKLVETFWSKVEVAWKKKNPEHARTLAEAQRTTFLRS